MMELRVVKAAIFKTECKECIKEGFNCSEPILSKGEQGLIDNYFIYAQNKDKTLFSKPVVLFGIYSDLPSKAYIQEDFPFEDKEYKGGCKIDREQFIKSYQLYSEIYPTIRNIAFKSCDEKEKEYLRTYLFKLEEISGEVLWGFYQTLFTDFFNWAKKQLGEE